MMKTLKNLGFVFDPSKLSDTDVLIYSVISDETTKIEKENIEKIKSKRK